MQDCLQRVGLRAADKRALGACLPGRKQDFHTMTKNDKEMDTFVKAVLEFQKAVAGYEYAWKSVSSTLDLVKCRAALLKTRRRLFYLFRKARKE